MNRSLDTTKYLCTCSCCATFAVFPTTASPTTASPTNAAGADADADAGVGAGADSSVIASVSDLAFSASSLLIFSTLSMLSTFSCLLSLPPAPAAPAVPAVPEEEGVVAEAAVWVVTSTNTSLYLIEGNRIAPGRLCRLITTLSPLHRPAILCRERACSRSLSVREIFTPVVSANVLGPIPSSSYSSTPTQAPVLAPLAGVVDLVAAVLSAALLCGVFSPPALITDAAFLIDSSEEVLNIVIFLPQALNSCLVLLTSAPSAPPPSPPPPAAAVDVDVAEEEILPILLVVGAAGGTDCVEGGVAGPVVAKVGVEGVGGVGTGDALRLPLKYVPTESSFDGAEAVVSVK
mmetsp:Transcript_51260/g.101255  ORF Transcript_51260/g.101255 Transcript_51260/m.101255 type:complete len:347 (+) Transcript_51260:350-1390(+)